MTNLQITDDVFFRQAGLDQKRVEGIVDSALARADDGELYLQYVQSESLTWDDGKLRAASFDTTSGFGMRAVVDDVIGHGHAAQLDEAAIRRAADTVSSVTAGHGGNFQAGPPATNRQLYRPDNPIEGHEFSTKVTLLEEIDRYARAKDPRVRQVSASIFASWAAVRIVRPGGQHLADVRPLVRLSVSIVAGDGDRQETGSYGAGGRIAFDQFFEAGRWQHAVDEALRQAVVNLGSRPAPAGEMTVVLGPGWPGVLLHEAVGHGLEGDFNRKKTSAFAGLMGQRVASPGVTVVDDGTLESRRGSLTIDDEGTPTQYTPLIEDGILVGYMQDRMNARLMGQKPTGNGRRQSFACQTMPRMTNTYMLAGDAQPEEIIASVKKGLYAVHFGGGQVDITSGKFVFSASEAYLIEDGRIGAPVKGATLIGNGPDALTRVGMVGNDLALDEGIGTCGKDGQTVAVGVGQPTLRIDGLTVGGTEAMA